MQQQDNQKGYLNSNAESEEKNLLDKGDPNHNKHQSEANLQTGDISSNNAEANSQKPRKSPKGATSEQYENQGQGEGGESMLIEDLEGNQGEQGVKTEKVEISLPIDDMSFNPEDFSEEKINQYAVMTAFKRENRRYCAHCQRFKPQRTHHCSQCGHCILKMDHHCPWVNNCVGFFNYKYFLNMIFWAGKMLLTALLMFVSCISGFYRMHFYRSDSRYVVRSESKCH